MPSSSRVLCSDGLHLFSSSLLNIMSWFTFGNLFHLLLELVICFFINFSFRWQDIHSRLFFKVLLSQQSSSFTVVVFPFLILGLPFYYFFWIPTWEGTHWKQKYFPNTCRHFLHIILPGPPRWSYFCLLPPRCNLRKETNKFPNSCLFYCSWVLLSITWKQFFDGILLKSLTK